MDFSHDIEQCLEVLKTGGLILYPTDTIWGIGCDATNSSAVEKIYALKKRPSSKSCIVLVSDEKELLRYVSQPDFRLFDYLGGLKTPTTVIYEGAIGLAGNLVAEDGTIGIRIVKDIFCKHLVKRFRKPIVSTSANISGQLSPAVFSEINAAILSGVDYVVKYRQEDQQRGLPSSVIKWNPDASVTLIR